MSQDTPSYANLANLNMLEKLYAMWLEDPQSVDPSFQNFFDGMQFAAKLPQVFPARQDSLDLRIFNLLNAYRTYGHLKANCDVTALQPKEHPGELALENFGLSKGDLDQLFPTSGLLEKQKAPLAEIIEVLEKTYCTSIGIEYMDLGSIEIENWIQSKIEPFFPSGLTNEDRVEILKQLNRAEGFETFLHVKYVGQKRFSLEGAESFIPTLLAILERGGELGVSDVILGMAHRGRLNVLANVMGKSHGYIFEEFEDFYTPDLSESTGDVKYHMGFAGTYATKGGKKIQVILSANPSHLESVDPVVEGGARAIQEQKKSKQNQKDVVPILVHGDAALSGQGVVYETMGLKDLIGYGTKGTIHIVINNQIGFTTLPKDSRSTRYCTDIAKAFHAPVLHVNGEDPEACVTAAHLAIELRQQFGTDVFIDLMGYRKYGHNEGDEPTFTQPLLYQMIRSKKTVRKIYQDHLVETSVLSQNDADAIESRFKEDLTHILDEVKSKKTVDQNKVLLKRGKHLEEMLKPLETKVDANTLKGVGAKLGQVPEGVNVHPKVQRLLKERAHMLSQNESEPVIDWGMGEMLAYATLATEGVHIRLSGQDVRRGTFSHRHALYVDQVTAGHYFPLSHLAQNQAPVDVFNSSLSECGVLGFEFGYSLMYPNSLVIWEGQYGDFANGAQVIIDQYIATSEMKWGHALNLTLLLPHGYEGSGPEHSSGRIERYLQLCADENLFVVNCSTPSQLFHALRRQALRPLKNPLIVFTPKALLRHPKCRSALKDFTEGRFEEILDDPNPPENPTRLLLCSGKIYYELVEMREEKKIPDAIVRIEQLYPLHKEKLTKIQEKYSQVKEYIWVQEEHENMGAYSHLRPQLEALFGKVRYVGRAPSASPAAGSHALHKLEKELLLQQLYQGTPS